MNLTHLSGEAVWKEMENFEAGRIVRKGELLCLRGIAEGGQKSLDHVKGNNLVFFENWI